MNALKQMSIRAVGADGFGLSVSFVRHHDRYAHTIAAVDGQLQTPLLASSEGTDQQDWPPSPPLQQLNIEARAAGDVALLIGIAGKSHWSLSVEAIRETATLVFDVACRCARTPERLGSVYRANIVPSPSGHLLIHGRECTIRADEQLAARLTIDDNQLILAPSTLDTAAPATVRWKYSVSIR